MFWGLCVNIKDNLIVVEYKIGKLEKNIILYVVKLFDMIVYNIINM